MCPKNDAESDPSAYKAWLGNAVNPAPCNLWALVETRWLEE